MSAPIRKAKTKARHRQRGFWLRVAAGLVVLTIAAPVALITYLSFAFPDPRQVGQRESAPTIRVLARDGTMLAERSENNDFIPIDLLPRHVLDAVIAIEDRRFYSHRGIDARGLLRAVWTNIRARRLVQGGSTITQQLAKNLFLTADRTLSRKLGELSYTFWLEWRLTKREILELYLNRVYYGAGAYGIEAASQRYFGKSARHLTLHEAALTAGLLKAPSRYSPFTSAVLARARARTVLHAMTDSGFITIDQEAKAVRQAPRLAATDAMKRPPGVEYAVDYALERLSQVVDDDDNDIVVETTIDPVLQTAAQAAVERVLEQEGRKLDATQAGVVVVDGAGGIRALVGGKRYGESRYNRAVKAHRQPGSAFKPFVYLAALERGMTADTTVVDQPITVAGWSPRNDLGQYRGNVPMRLALAHSINSVAVRLQQNVGTQRVIETARRLGIQSDLDSAPSLALGTSEVTLLELTGAYATLANEGVRREPYVIRRVTRKGGAVIFEHAPGRPRTVVTPAALGQMNDMLNAAIVSGTGRRAALPTHPAAGKTGTSQEHRDAWFVGYTAHMTAGVWVGNDNAQPMDKVMGGSLPAMIWKDVMLAAHRGLPARDLYGMQRARPPEEPPQVLTSARRNLRGSDERISEAFTEKAPRGDKRGQPQSWPDWLGSLLGLGSGGSEGAVQQ